MVRWIISILAVIGAMEVFAVVLPVFNQPPPKNVIFPQCYDRGYKAIEKCVRLEAIANGRDPDEVWQFNYRQR